MAALVLSVMGAAPASDCRGRELSAMRVFSSSLLLSSLQLSDAKVYEPEIRALLGTAAHFCEVAVLMGVRPIMFDPSPSDEPGASCSEQTRSGCGGYRGTSLIRNRQPPRTTRGP